MRLCSSRLVVLAILVFAGCPYLWSQKEHKFIDGAAAERRSVHGSEGFPDTLIQNIPCKEEDIPRYTASHVSAAPVIDGNLDEQIWREATRSTPFVDLVHAHLPIWIRVPQCCGTTSICTSGTGSRNPT